MVWFWLLRGTRLVSKTLTIKVDTDCDTGSPVRTHDGQILRWSFLTEWGGWEKGEFWSPWINILFSFYSYLVNIQYIYSIYDIKTRIIFLRILGRRNTSDVLIILPNYADKSRGEPCTNVTPEVPPWTTPITAPAPLPIGRRSLTCTNHRLLFFPT